MKPSRLEFQKVSENSLLYLMAMGHTVAPMSKAPALNITTYSLLVQVPAPQKASKHHHILLVWYHCLIPKSKQTSPHTRLVPVPALQKLKQTPPHTHCLVHVPPPQLSANITTYSWLVQLPSPHKQSKYHQQSKSHHTFVLWYKCLLPKSLQTSPHITRKFHHIQQENSTTRWLLVQVPALQRKQISPHTTNKHHHILIKPQLPISKQTSPYLRIHHHI
eukprot:jgi/Botrbrau1/23480/Bobra.106_1s0032.1